MSVSPHVLIVAGPADPVSESVVRALRAQGVSCESARFGDTAAKLDRCDVVIVVGAPEDPLVEVVPIWCERREVPIIVIGDLSRELRASALEAGVAFILPTTTEAAELVTAVRAAQEQNQGGSPELVRAMTRTMCSLSALIAQATDTSFLEAAVVQIAELFGAQTASIMLFDSDDEDAPLRVIASVGLPNGKPGPRRGGVAERVAKSRIPRIILRKASEVAGFSGVELRNDISASMCVPIPAPHGMTERPRGVVNVARARAGSVFTPRDLEVCESIAALLNEALTTLEQRQLSTALQQRMAAVERLSTIGEIAGGIAHEVANPIACVRANVEVLAETLRELLPYIPRQGMPQDLLVQLDDLPELLNDAIEGVRRSDEVVKRMKSLVRLNGSTRAERVELRDLVAETLRLLRPRLHLPVIVEVPAGLCVTGSRTELSQVLVNLLVNGADACEERAAKEPGVTPRIVVAGNVAEGKCILSVADNGSGISPAAMKQLFLPLFTTKAERGTGLGLSIVRRIIAEHGGTVRASSVEGEGTVFVIALPLAAPAHEVSPAS